jgi:hypothetical protein
MHKHELSARRASVRHVQAVIDSANQVLERRFEHHFASASVVEWFGDLVIISAGAIPGDGVVLTVKPRSAPASLLRGTSVLLYPYGSYDAALPVRFGALNRDGQFNVRGLHEGSYWIELCAPWWLDDQICDDVRAGQLKWAFIDVPVVLPRALESRGQETRKELAAARSRPWTMEFSAHYLSGDESLEYSIRENDVLEIKAGLRSPELAGCAAVYLGEVVSPITLRSSIELPSSLFTDAAATMRCVRLMMLAARPQQPPPVPWTISTEFDERLAAGLVSDSVTHRWAAAVELRAQLHELCDRTARRQS